MNQERRRGTPAFQKNFEPDVDFGLSRTITRRRRDIVNKYLCLCYYSQKQFDAMSPADLETMVRECQPHDARLRASGRLLLSSSLALPNASRSIRVSGGGEPVASEGPYTSTPEPVGALLIIEAENMDDAVRIAMLHPGPHLGKFMDGGIEVRQFEHFELALRPGSGPA